MRTPARSAAWTALAPVSVVLLALFVHRRVLSTFFALDDLVMFQQVHGVLPWPVTPWRFLSGVAWFRAVTPLFGTRPEGYHAASLLLHIGNALLLGKLARRWGASPPAAWLAAGLFAASRLHFSAMMAVTSVGELLALTGTLAALLLVAPGTHRWLAVACFAAGLLCKESVLLVPLAALAIPAMGERLSERARRLAPLIVAGPVIGGGLLVSGILSGRLGGRAYAIGVGGNMTDGLANLFGWSVDVVHPIPDQVLRLEPIARFGLPAIVLLVSIAVFRMRGAPLLRAGWAWWCLGVLPVLPLIGHTYLHYLYTPLAGLALALGGLCDLAFSGRRARRGAAPDPAPWITVALVLLAHAAVSDALLERRFAARMASADWPLDPVLRKSEIARRSIGDVRSELKGRRARIAIVQPEGASSSINLTTGIAFDSPDRPAQSQLEAVLDGGKSLLAFVPNVDSVVFVNDYVPGHDDFDFFLAQRDCHVADLGPPSRAHPLIVASLVENRLFPAALDYLGKALADRPGEPALLYVRGLAQLRMGNRRQAYLAFRELVARAPNDSLSLAVKPLLGEDSLRMP